MFRADLAPMAAVIEEMRKVPRQLNGCMDELSQAARVLRELSYLDGPLKQLKRAQDRMDREGAQALELQRALETIREQYRRSEQGVMDYCEETGAMVRREAASYQRLDWVGDLLKETLT
ncbi:MAG: hypothetical protein LIP16_13225 [Clostridium sp.]|nr:hypothetical protein [Clostridium sp.]